MLKDNSVSSGLRKRHLDIYPKHILTMKYTKLTRMEIQNTNIFTDNRNPNYFNKNVDIKLSAHNAFLGY